MRKVTGETTPRHRRDRRTIPAIFLALALAAVACGGASGNDESEDSDPAAEAASNEPYYSSDDIISILVPGSVGGGSDTSARFVAPFMQDFIEGNPEVQVENAVDIPTVTAVNQFLDAPADGLHLLMTSTSSKLPTLLGQAGVEYSLSDFEPIVGMQNGAVVYVRGDSPIEEATDLADYPEELQYAGQTALGGDTTLLLAFEMLNMNVNSTMGYDGRGPARVALEQGESSINYDTSSSYLEHVAPLVEEGTFRPLFSFGAIENGEYVRDPLFPDLPHLKEVYEEAYGEEPSGNAWGALETIYPARLTINKAIWAPVGTPPEAVEALKQAFRDMQEDDTFSADKEEALGPYALYLDENMDAVVENLRNLNQEDVDWMLEWLQEEYQVNLDDL